MKILVTGATGFIAESICKHLISSGHEVICCVRDTRFAEKIFPGQRVIACDFIQDNTEAVWLPRLRDIDAVINCVGILQHRRREMIWKTHYETPKALFDACARLGIKTFVQLSALGVDHTQTEFARSKKAMDDYLQNQIGVSTLIIRPSLVYGKGSYGGTSLFRGLAGLPMIPLVDKGRQTFQPIHIDDLAQAIVDLLEQGGHKKIVLDAVGPETISLRQVLSLLRQWLGFSKAKFINVPKCLTLLACRVGDWLGNTTINSTSYQMLTENNVSSEKRTRQFFDVVGFVPKNFQRGLFSEPSYVQDRWHAKLYFLKPALRLSIGFLWVFTALTSLFFYPRTHSYALLQAVGLKGYGLPLALYGASLLDLLLGLSTLCNYRLKWTGLAQCGLMFAYSVIIAVLLPRYWLHPFAPLAKNIPLIAATLIMIALENKR